MATDFNVYCLSDFRVKQTDTGNLNIKKEQKWISTVGTSYPGSEKSIVKYRNMILTLEDLGNYIYGYHGAAYGFTLATLVIGSGLNQEKNCLDRIFSDYTFLNKFATYKIIYDSAINESYDRQYIYKGYFAYYSEYSH